MTGSAVLPPFAPSRVPHYGQGFSSACYLYYQYRILSPVYSLLFNPSQVTASDPKRLEQCEDRIANSNLDAFIACASIILRVAFVTMRYTPTCFQSCMMLGVFFSVDRLLTSVQNVKKKSSNVNDVPHKVSRAIFYSMVLLRTATIIISISLLIFYRDYSYLSGMLLFGILSCVAQSGLLFKSESTRTTLIGILLILGHLVSVCLHPMAMVKIMSTFELCAVTPACLPGKPAETSDELPQ